MMLKAKGLETVPKINQTGDLIKKDKDIDHDKKDNQISFQQKNKEK